MSDHYHALTVILAEDVKDEYAQPLIDAILQLKGVLSVEPHVSDLETRMAESRARHELRKKLWDVLRDT